MKLTKSTNPHKYLFLLALLFLLSSPLFALHIEGGFNYQPERESDGSWFGTYNHNWNPFGSFSFFPLSLKRENKEIWRGISLQTTYMNKRLFLTTYYGHVELKSNPMRSIYIGLKADIVKFQSVGLSLKGTNYYGKAFIASIIIDPRYDFKNDDMIWDFKLSIGLGRHLPIF